MISPRERAEAAFRQTEGVVVSLPAAIHACEAAIIADRRELLAPDEATEVALVSALMGCPDWAAQHDVTNVRAATMLANTALAALRRLKGVER